MSLFNMIEKVAKEKIIEKVENEITKKQNHVQTNNYCTYVINNIARICNLLSDLQNETEKIINDILSMKDVKMSFKEKNNFRKNKEKANTNLQYLYLARDFFIVLSKNASDIELTSEELMLVIKFAPYFDGTPVLELDYEDIDDSILGAFKEVGQELKSAFISSKKNPTHFIFEEYLYRYDEKIKDYIFPDIDSAIENFKNTMTNQKNLAKDVNPIANSNDFKCSNCNANLSLNSKFCPECGTKTKIEKPLFCTQCGKSITTDAKFCGNCGAKI